MQPPQANAKPTERFGYVIDGLCRSANVFMNVLGHALVALIERRLRRLQTRFNRLAAALAAGTPRRVLASRAGVAGRPRPAFMGPVLRLPADPGWLIRLSPSTAIQYAADLEYLLTTDAPTMALVASDPRFGRILRPLFHMIGRDPPSCVPALPPPAPRARKPRAARAKAPRPVKQVTGRALRKYLPWAGPRPWPAIKPRSPDVADVAKAVPKTTG